MAKSDAGSAEVAGVRITHPDRVLFPDLGLTKLDLARYYQAVGGRLLPHLRDRPLSLVRCPSGRERPVLLPEASRQGVSEDDPAGPYPGEGGRFRRLRRGQLARRRRRPGADGGAGDPHLGLPPRPA